MYEVLDLYFYMCSLSMTCRIWLWQDGYLYTPWHNTGY
ncbi:MAG: hypothetical protein IPM26_17200 [Saprospiraceae bacterium]|nr:hypothetical protein [Saprospiraceae bacterium]